MTSAEVVLWGTLIGTVTFDNVNGVGYFEYSRDFLTSGIQVSPIMMPLAERVYSFPELRGISFHGLPGLLSDSLPDKFGNRIIDAWLSSQGRTPESFDPVERLCYTGNRGMGALEFRPMKGPKASEAESIDVDKLVKLAEKILTERKNFHIEAGPDAMQEIIRVGTSAGGARAKGIVAWNPETGDIRSGQIDAGKGYDYWIIKFDGVSGNGDKEGDDGPQYTQIEYAYYLMAEICGIKMEKCRLYEENGRHHFMTLRFDRERGSGRKIHMQTLGGIAHFDYNMPGSCSYEQAATVMRQLFISKNEIMELYRRMVFNVLARNQDDHVKNISFLMDRAGKWSLSPAYDVTYAYNPDGMWTGSHQMTVNGKREHIEREDLIASAIHMGIRKGQAEEIIDEVSVGLRKWKEFAESAGLKDKTADLIEKEFIVL